VSAASLSERLLVTRLPTGPDTELVIQLVNDGTHGPQLDIREARRVALGADAESDLIGPYEPTCAGFLLPLALAPALMDAVSKMVRRAKERAIWGPPGGAA
jgi:hypothetical protein